MEYRLNCYSISETGERYDSMGNPHQEDSLYPQHGRCSEEDRLFIVCDGMGGHDHGEVASNVVCQALSTSIFKRMRAGSGVFTERLLDRALDDTYAALDANDTNAPKKMGTTMAMLMLTEQGYITAHIGDSRVYHFRPGDDGNNTRLIFCTEDHSLANTLRRNGRIAEAEEAAAKRHVITRAMQPHMEHRSNPDIHTSADIRPGDYFMLCSHGMLDNLSDDLLKYIFSHQGGNDRNKYNLLMKATASNRDNHSAIVVHIDEVYNNNAARQKAQAHKDMQSQPSNTPAMKRAYAIAGKAKEIIRRGKGDSSTGQVIAKFLIALMGLLTVIMLIYYAFIHHDENPPEAGRAYDGAVQEQEYEGPKEEFGYETAPNTKTGDEEVGQGKDETVQQGEEIIQETADPQPQAEPTAEPTVEPETPSAPSTPSAPEPSTDPGALIIE